MCSPPGRELAGCLPPHDMTNIMPTRAEKRRNRVPGGAGQSAGFTDEAYALTGATLTNREALLAQANVIVAVRFLADVDAWRENGVLISLGTRDAALDAALAKRRARDRFA